MTVSELNCIISKYKSCFYKTQEWINRADKFLSIISGYLDFDEIRDNNTENLGDDYRFLRNNKPEIIKRLKNELEG